jgi:phosphodiesterase/alkaline phosphatase D-like protein
MGPQVQATSTGAVVSWETFQAAGGQVAYGLTAPTNLTGQSSIGKLHQIQLDHLSPGTTYAYQIQSRDAAGNLGTSEGHFTTVGLGEVKVTDIADMAATIRWSSNQPTDSLVELGTTIAYGDRQGNGGQLTNHSLRLVGLKPNQTYHFRIIATNSNGTSVFGDNIFTTLAFPAIAGSNQTPEELSASTDNIKLWPEVPFAQPLVLGASSAATALSDGFTVGRNLLTGKASPSGQSWMIIVWLVPLILVGLIAIVWWKVRKQPPTADSPQSGS